MGSSTLGVVSDKLRSVPGEQQYASRFPNVVPRDANGVVLEDQEVELRPWSPVRFKCDLRGRSEIYFFVV